MHDDVSLQEALEWRLNIDLFLSQALKKQLKQRKQAGKWPLESAGDGSSCDSSLSPPEVRHSQLDKDDDVTMVNKDTYNFDDYF